MKFFFNKIVILFFFILWHATLYIAYQKALLRKDALVQTQWNTLESVLGSQKKLLELKLHAVDKLGLDLLSKALDTSKVMDTVKNTSQPTLFLEKTILNPYVLGMVFLYPEAQKQGLSYVSVQALRKNPLPIAWKSIVVMEAFVKILKEASQKKQKQFLPGGILGLQNTFFLFSPMMTAQGLFYGVIAFQWDVLWESLQDVDQAFYLAIFSKSGKLEAASSKILAWLKEHQDMYTKNASQARFFYPFPSQNAPDTTESIPWVLKPLGSQLDLLLAQPPVLQDMQILEIACAVVLEIIFIIFIAVSGMVGLGRFAPQGNTVQSPMLSTMSMAMPPAYTPPVAPSLQPPASPRATFEAQETLTGSLPVFPRENHLTKTSSKQLTMANITAPLQNVGEQPIVLKEAVTPSVENVVESVVEDEPLKLTEVLQQGVSEIQDATIALRNLSMPSVSSSTDPDGGVTLSNLNLGLSQSTNEAKTFEFAAETGDDLHPAQSMTINVASEELSSALPSMPLGEKEEGSVVKKDGLSSVLDGVLAEAATRIQDAPQKAPVAEGSAAVPLEIVLRGKAR